MNTGMLNGFNGIQSTLCQGFSGVNQGMAQQTFDLSTQLHNMAAASADCCCQTQRAIERGFADTNYNLAT
jgi:pseudouridine-5'-phosphate glycosidase